MAKKIASVDILTDTFETHILRTNEIIDAIDSDIITANTTQGVTGTAATPRHARLFGSFTANTVAANTLSVGTVVANSTQITVSTGVKLVASGSAGAAGQALVSDGTSISWQTIAGSGTVTQIANGAGIIFTNVAGKAFDSPITSFGTIALKAGPGITIDAQGISVNTAYIATSTTNAATLQGRTWAAPAAIGSTTANTGSFTSVTASPIDGYRLRNDPVFLISNTVFITQGRGDFQTPYSSPTDTTGGIRVRGQRIGTPVAYIQVTDQYGSEWGHFKTHANGYCSWSSSFVATSYPNLIAPGTVMLFAQANAPTGWTKVTTHNDKALRVVSGTGGVSGGSTSFSAAFNATYNSQGHTLTAEEMPVHRHGMFDQYDITESYDVGSYPGYTVAWESGSGGDTEYSLNTNLAQTAEYGISGSAGSSQPHSHGLNFNLSYVDVILASKN